jgi:NitT/TauT family transport system permease protein
VSALIPLLILWSASTSKKISVIFIGTFFQQLILIADARAACHRICWTHPRSANRRVVALCSFQRCPA